MRKRRLRIEAWAGAEGCFLVCGVWSCTKPARGAKEVERTLPNPAPGGTSSAAPGVRPDPVRAARLRLSARSSSPIVHILCSTKANLRANATLALPRPRRLATRTAQDFRAHQSRLW